MIEPSGTAAAIIAAAERRMREGGFHGFSFREIAADVGIKSASVHHHFPTKEDLAAAVARAYTERHMADLGDPKDPRRAPADLIALYVDLFRYSLVEDRRMCLCGILATEASALPSGLNSEAKAFFARNLAWLEAVVARIAPGARRRDVKAKALGIAATLEGAMLVAHSLGDMDAFEAVVRELNESLSLRSGRKKR
jgi:TetR/AcrR family transcriptional regulator, transcriptional repressor for nem operon